MQKNVQATLRLAETNNSQLTRPAVFSGMSVGSFPEQRLVIELLIYTQKIVEDNENNRAQKQTCGKNLFSSFSEPMRFYEVDFLLMVKFYVA